MSAQMGGFGLAGLSRRILVWPASMIWPYNLIITTNLNTLHAGHDPSSPGVSRFKFFMTALLCTFIYQFFPGKFRHRFTGVRFSLHGLSFSGYIMTCLSYFSWICWIKPGEKNCPTLSGPKLMTHAASRQRYRQSAIRRLDGLGYGNFDLRLVSDLVCRKSLEHPLVGPSQCGRLFCRCLLVYRTHTVLH